MWWDWQIFLYKNAKSKTEKKILNEKARDREILEINKTTKWTLKIELNNKNKKQKTKYEPSKDSPIPQIPIPHSPLLPIIYFFFLEFLKKNIIFTKWLLPSLNKMFFNKKKWENNFWREAKPLSRHILLFISHLKYF